MTDNKFWQNKWQSGEIGFHRDECNPALAKFWPNLRLSRKSTVFVPLCGKSKDMLYLREYGHSVFGVELCELAIKDFASENKMRFHALAVENFINYVGNGFSLLVGDYFNTGPSVGMRNIAAVYDRAALVALPKDMRKNYAEHLKSLLDTGARILLITLEYDQSQMDGPPFSVNGDEVEALFGSWCEIEHWHEGEPEMFKDKISMVQHIYALTVNHDMENIIG
ncbi:MAG: thiopurine S-methyltransferase [Robiginitomaculum sp.]